MVFKSREGVRGSWGKNEQKESWRVRSRLMEERNGRVNHVQNRMCGRGGAAGAAKTFSEKLGESISVSSTRFMLASSTEGGHCLHPNLRAIDAWENLCRENRSWNTPSERVFFITVTRESNTRCFLIRPCVLGLTGAKKVSQLATIWFWA